MGRVMSDKALRDYAYKVISSEYGERREGSVVIPAQMSKREMAAFAAGMPQWQLDQMYDMMYGSEMVE